jgi:HSP20 family protein
MERSAMTDPHTDTVPERAVQPPQRAGGETRAPKSAHAEPASFRRDGETGPEPASMASARDLIEAGREIASARREAALAGADLWSRSFEPFYAFQSGMMRWFDDLWREAASGLHPAQPARAFSVAPFLGLPPVDVKETADAYILSVEVPGLSEQDVKVTVEGDVLTLRGHKSQDRDEATSTYRLSERRFGRFERTFRLPQGVARDRFDASIRDGVLKVVLPKNRPAEIAPGTAARH